MEKPMENTSDHGEDPEEIPPRAPRKICALRAILDGMPEEWKDLDGMSQQWNDNAEQDDAEIIQPGEGPAGRKTTALSAILSGMPRVMERRDSEQTRALFLEEMSRQFGKKEGRKDRGNDAATQTAMEAEIERGLRTRQYSEVLDSLATSASENTDDQKSYTQKLDDMVHQTGDEGLIRSWNAKKKQRADKLAVSTRSSATMLNSAFNVKEFTDDSRSYSVWLDGQSSEDQDPNTQDGETHEQSEDGEPREPRFREDSAANFLNSVTSQILDEFGDSRGIEVDDAHDESEDPNDPSSHEDSEDKLLGAVIQQVMEEFTGYTSRECPTSDHSEGPKQRRFRERSALRFLKALSEQIRPELKMRAGGEHRSREKSALQFLNTVREQIMERVQDTPPQIPTPSSQDVQPDIQYEIQYEIPNSSDHNAHSETEYEVDFVRDENVQAETNYESPRSSDQNAQSETANSVETSSDQHQYVQPETEYAVETSSDHDVQTETQYEEE